MQPLGRRQKQSAPLVGLAHLQPQKEGLKTVTPQRRKAMQRVLTEALREDPHWEFLEGRRESHLNALFLRRKTLLESISRTNKQIYQRIQHQESHYHRSRAGTLLEPNNENLTSGSRILLALSKHALALSNHPRLDSLEQTH
jgi:hypothetical protein